MQMYNGLVFNFDDGGCVCIDDLEMCFDVQVEVKIIWLQIMIENFFELIDIVGYCIEFLKMFGFGFFGIDYEVDIELYVLMV